MYEIVIAGRATRTVRIALDDLVEDWRDDAAGESCSAILVDQSRLLAAIEQLHDLGVVVEQIRHRDDV